MRAVYEVMRDERALIEPLWLIVDSYVKLSHRDKVMFIFAVRDVPEIHAGLRDVVTSLDEDMWLRYDLPNTGQTWQNMCIIDRINAMNRAVFRCEYARSWDGTRDVLEYDSVTIVDWAARLFDECKYGGFYARETHGLKRKFALTMLGGMTM